MQMIIGLTGLARSGKDTVANYLSNKYGFAHLDFARDALFAEADKRGVEKDKMSLSVLGDELRQESGRAVLAKIINSKIQQDKPIKTTISSLKKEDKVKQEKSYAITGFRSPEEVDLIRNEHLDFVLIEVSANPVIRFKRRTDKDPDNEELFNARDKRDIYNKGLGEVLKMADYKVLNEDSFEELYLLVDDLMKKIVKEF